MKNKTTKCQCIVYLSTKDRLIQGCWNLAITINGAHKSYICNHNHWLIIINIYFISLVPGPPIIEDIIHGSHNFTVTWKEPERRAGNITGYTVFIDPLGPMYDIDSTRCSIENQSLTTNLEGYELSYSFMDARPYYEYNVSIVAATSKGNGSSNTTIANTLSASK